MTYDVHLTETFQKSIKALKKKYPHVKDDLLSQIEAFEEDPPTGDPIPGWNKEVWKVRGASSDVKNLDANQKDTGYAHLKVTHQMRIFKKTWMLIKSILGIFIGKYTPSNAHELKNIFTLDFIHLLLSNLRAAV